MQIFELHFNPKNKKGKLVDTFCYQPSDVYEKRLGALAIAGELTEGSSNKTLLNNLASKIKGAYHSLPTRSQEEALREGLQKGNQFLSKESWSGDLNLATLSLKGNQLQFSKIGEIKILLSRNNELTDIGKNASEEDYNFGSIVTGKIKKEDKLIVLTEDIYKEFLDKDLLIELAQSKSINNQILEKISKIQKEKFPKTPGVCLLIDFSIETTTQEKIINKDQFSFKKSFLKLAEETRLLLSLLFQKMVAGLKSGASFLKERGVPALMQVGALLVVVSKDIKKLVKFILKKGKTVTLSIFSKSSKKVKKKTKDLKESALKKKKKVSYNFKQQKENISPSKNKTVVKPKTNKKLIDFSQKKDSLLEFLSGIIKRGQNFLSRAFSKIKSKVTKIKLKEKLPGQIIDFKIPEEKEKRRSIKLAGLLVLIILVGSLTAHSERARRMEEEKEKLSQIKVQIEEINPENSEAYGELLDHYQNLDQLISQGVAYNSQAENLRNLTGQKLLKISNTQIIEDPQLLFSPEEVLPSKIEYVNGEVYSYNPFLANAEKYNPETDQQLVRPINPKDGGIFAMTALNEDEILFFSRPDELIFSNTDQISRRIETPYDDFSFQKLESYQNQIYLLERKNNQIVRYNRNDLSNPNLWIQERRPGDITSFAIDGSIWILKNDNKIWRYEENRPASQPVIEITDLFPVPEKFTNIKTKVDDPLFILESSNNRIIAVSKEGQLLKQFILPNAKNIKDFAIGQNKIYLLDDQEVYQLEVEF